MKEKLVIKNKWWTIDIVFMRLNNFKRKGDAI